MTRSVLARCASFALLLTGVAACGEDGPGQPATVGTAVAVAGDFAATGVLTTIDAESLEVSANALDGVAGADPLVRRVGAELFVLNRFGGDNVTIVDAATLTLVDQIATGAGSNPQDVAVVGNKLYIAALGVGSLLVIDRANPTEIAEISLAELDDDDMPDCVSAHAVGDRVFVACGLLDENFMATGPGKIAVIDTGDDTVTSTFDLPASNPSGWFIQSPAGSAFAGDLLIATVPSFTDYSTGCLARVSTGATPSASCAISNEDLGGFVNRAVVRGDSLWTIVATYDATFTASGSLRHIDLRDGTIGDALNPASMLVKDLAACGEHLFVADKTMGAEGVRVYLLDGDAIEELTDQPLDIGLPPGFGNGLDCMVAD